MKVLPVISGIILLSIMNCKSDQSGHSSRDLLPIPDKLVVLTFDDGCKSDVEFVMPLLREYGFGATFFYTDAFLRDETLKDEHYSTWEDAKTIHDAGLEIGSHTYNHPWIPSLSKSEFREELETFEQHCEKHGIPVPKSFCYPSDGFNREAVEVLREKGYPFALRGVKPEFPETGEGGRGPVYNPAEDDPLMVPCTGNSGPAWGFEDFLWALEQGGDGKIPIVSFHGVPDLDHPWVNTDTADFRKYMDYLRDNDYTVIALRDLADYVDPSIYPDDPFAPMEKRLGLSVAEPSCEYAEDPLGLDTEQPRFSWMLTSYQRGQVQTAYQILVASSEKNLQKDKGDKWDSGKQDSDQSVHVTYEGDALESSEQCWWKVRVWDKDGKASDYSNPSKFEMGLLEQDDWQGLWIGDDKSNASPLLRKDFTIKKNIKQARAYISGLGWYELYINGGKVGDHVLDPAHTEYHKHILYATYDVTDLLMQGENAMGVILGNGFLSEPDHYRYGDSPRLRMQLNIEHSDGSTTSLVSDDTWKVSGGPVVYNDIFGGETYDARLEQPGWAETGFDDGHWDNALIKEEPGGDMASQVLEPIRVGQTMKPVKITQPQPGIFVCHFDQLFGGWIRLGVKGPEGTQLTINYSARIYKESGLIDQRRHMRHGIEDGTYDRELETDYYTLKGDPEGETYEPRFTYHPVQYVQIKGYPGELTLQDVEGCVIYSDADMYGDFSCSNPLLNQIHQNVTWTLINGSYGFPLDCLHREHWAWTDPGTVAGSLYTRKHMPLFWTKWLMDIADAQWENGAIPVIAPYYIDFGTDPAWGGNYPILVWYLHQYYGDMRILEEHYAGMTRWMDYLTSIAEDHIVVEGSLGDHMVPGSAPGEEEYLSSETPPQLVWTGYYYRGAAIMAEVARVLGKSEDAGYYQQLAEDIGNAFNKKWFNAEKNIYASGSQTANIWPIALGIVPGENEDALMKNIINSIEKEYNGHFHTGNTGTNSMIDVLTEYGYGDVMYRVVTSTDYPGWGYMVKEGATTIWESWGLTNNAESMIMWGTIDEFFYNDLAGIKGPEYNQPGYMDPGFRTISIMPYVPEDLEFAGASLRTVRGIVSSNWKKKDGSLILEVTLPANSRALVSVPKIGLSDVTIKEHNTTLWQEGAYVEGVAGITGGIESTDYVTFEAGSGTYKFQISGSD